eukprot:2525329-Pyramimonas_sp.AAC.1
MTAWAGSRGRDETATWGRAYAPKQAPWMIAAAGSHANRNRIVFSRSRLALNIPMGARSGVPSSSLGALLGLSPRGRCSFRERSRRG